LFPPHAAREASILAVSAITITRFANLFFITALLFFDRFYYNFTPTPMPRPHRDSNPDEECRFLAFFGVKF
jgi:hypothetical protein